MLRRFLMISLIVASFHGQADAQELRDPAPTTLARVEALDLSRAQLRRGTWMLTAGTVMAIAGGTFLHLGLSSYCHEAGKPPRLARTAGALQLAAGLGLAIGGVFPLRQQHDAPRGTHRGARIFANMALGAVLGALMSGPAIAAATPDLMLCE
jgi:hypothetical protein